LNQENATELFEACSNKSYEQVELVLAARFPKPDVRDLVRRLPVKFEARTASAPDIGSGLTAMPSASSARSLAAASVAGTADRQQTRPETAPATPARPERKRITPLSADRFGVHFTADTEFRELLDEVRALASHGLPQDELLPLMKRALQAYRSELRKSRFGIGRKPRARSARNGAANGTASGQVNAREASNEKRSRHVPANVGREVYARDEGCCTFVSEDGRRCAARRFLEIDHVKPWAEGGLATVENLRLRCRAHNLHAARNHFGAVHVQESVTRARGTIRVPASVQS
jgi:5-methylcytosine-specific restriction endonuclease McrA